MMKSLEFSCSFAIYGLVVMKSLHCCKRGSLLSFHFPIISLLQNPWQCSNLHNAQVVLKEIVFLLELKVKNSEESGLISGLSGMKNGTSLINVPPFYCDQLLLWRCAAPACRELNIQAMTHSNLELHEAKKGIKISVILKSPRPSDL